MVNAVRLGAYIDVAECNRRVVELKRLYYVRDAFCLPVNQ